MRKIWRKYKQSDFSVNVTSQILGTGIAQVIPFIMTPILTRVYTEKDFAVYTSFFAMATIFAVGVGGKYHLAIVLPKRDIEAKRLYALSNYVTIFYALALVLFFSLFHRFFSAEIGEGLIFVPVYILFFGAWNSLVYFSVRKKEFKHNAKAKVFQSVTYVFAAIGIGLFYSNSYGLIVAKVIAVLAAILFFLKKFPLSYRFVSFKKLIKVAKQYKDFPKHGVFPAFLNTISSQALILTLTKFYGVADLGFFGLTNMVLSAPLGLIGTSYRDVFYQKMVSLLNLNKGKDAIRIFKRSALFLLALGLPIALVLLIYGPEVFSIVFGAKWEISGVFASILSLSLLIKLIVSPLSSIFNALNKLKWASVWQTFYFVTTSLLLIICAMLLKLDIRKLLYAYVIHELLLYSIYFLMQFRVIKRFAIDNMKGDKG